jgi:hypothetical protein
LNGLVAVPTSEVDDVSPSGVLQQIADQHVQFAGVSVRLAGQMRLAARTKQAKQLVLKRREHRRPIARDYRI